MKSTRSKDKSITIHHLKQKLAKFVKDRDWEQYHSPKNLSMSIAIEAADFVLIDSDITKVTEILDLSKQTLLVVKQNLFWAFGYNAIARPFAMAGKLNPTISSAAMALSSLSVIANSLRLRKK